MNSSIALLVCLICACFGAQAADMSLVGIVPFRSINTPAVEGFKNALREQGFVEGRNIRYEEIAPSGDLKELEATLPTLLAKQPRLIFVVTTPASQVVVRLASAAKVPVVFAPISDPLAAGLVPDLRHPGGYATGVRLSPTNGMRLAFLLKAAPKIHRVYFPYSTSDVSAKATLEQVRAVASDLGVELLLHPLPDNSPVSDATTQIPAGAEAIFIPQDSRLEARIDDFVAVARERKLPLSVPSVWQVEHGGLISYGFDLRDAGRQAGRMAAEVLEGEQPGDLPVETTENQLWLNMRAAHEIGLDITEALLKQARRIIY
jgi:putative tryptophan/tyrosine transport system substrate-binding protein